VASPSSQAISGLKGDPGGQHQARLTPTVTLLTFHSSR
jgi:hypothetical protein